MTGCRGPAPDRLQDFTPGLAKLPSGNVSVSVFPMNLRWLVFDYVDPELHLMPEQRKRVRRRGLLSANEADKQTGWGPAMFAALTPGLAMLLGMVVYFAFFRTSLIGIAVMLGVQIAITWIVFAFIGRFTWRPLVCAELRRMGHEVCPACGYWLRGLGDHVQRCPECGNRREAMSS